MDVLFVVGFHTIVPEFGGVMWYVAADRRRKCAALAFLGIFATISAAALSTQAQTPTLPWPAANEILSEVVPPVFPAQTFNVASFGANGNGSADNTSAFARAITACNAAGGGMVEVPTGTYVCGAIELL